MMRWPEAVRWFIDADVSMTKHKTGIIFFYFFYFIAAKILYGNMAGII